MRESIALSKPPSTHFSINWSSYTSPLTGCIRMPSLWMRWREELDGRSGKKCGGSRTGLEGEKLGSREARLTTHHPQNIADVRCQSKVRSRKISSTWLRREEQIKALGPYVIFRVLIGTLNRSKAKVSGCAYGSKPGQRVI